VLHRVLREHLETFLAQAKARNDGDGLPMFIEREFREFLSCGVLASGFARFRCDECGHGILIAFSCKGRGFCPSCCGRRMAELAAHLADRVFGDLPVRQWVSPSRTGSAMRSPGTTGFAVLYSASSSARFSASSAAEPRAAAFKAVAAAP
jgi:Transposase zinc-binding domain